MESVNIALSIEGPTAKELSKKFMSSDKYNNDTLDFNEFKNLVKVETKKILNKF